MYFVLRRRNVDLVPQLIGFCGDLIAFDPVPQDDLYMLPASFYSSWNAFVAAPVANFIWPKWTRAKHSLSLLNFASVLYNGGHDSLYACDTDLSKLYRLDATGSVRMSNFGGVYSQWEVESLIVGKECSSDEDCMAMTSRCEAPCDKTTGRCLRPHSITRRICEMIVSNLIPGVSTENAAKNSEESRLLGVCSELSQNDVTTADRHAFVLNQLNSSLLHFLHKYE